MKTKTPPPQEGGRLSNLEKRLAMLETPRLEDRIQMLEAEVNTLREHLRALSDEMQKTHRQVDDRTLRGENLLLAIQGELLGLIKSVEKIGEMLKIPPALKTPPDPPPQDEEMDLDTPPDPL